MNPYRVFLRGQPAEALPDDVSLAFIRVSRGAISLYSDHNPEDLKKLWASGNELLKITSAERWKRAFIVSEEQLVKGAVVETLKELKESGLIWNPIADILAERTAWEGEAFVNMPPGYVPLNQWLEQLDNWISESGIAGAVEAFKVFKSSHFRKYVTERVDLTIATKSDIDKLGSQEEFLGWLLTNPSMSSRLAGEIVRGMYETPVTAGTKRDGRTQAVGAALAAVGALPIKDMEFVIRKLAERAKNGDTGRSYRIGGYHSSSPQEDAAGELGALGKLWFTDERLTEEILCEIAESLRPASSQVAVVLFHPNMSSARRDILLNNMNPERKRAVFWNIVNYVKTAPIEYLKPLVTGDLSDDKLIVLMGHPSADESIWRLAVGRSGRDIRAALAATPLAADPSVRKELIGSTAMDVLKGLLNTAGAEEWQAIFYRILRKDGPEALKILAETKLPEGVALPAGWVKKFMLSSDSETRELAVKCLPKCSGGKGASAPPPDRAPRLRRS